MGNAAFDCLVLYYHSQRSIRYASTSDLLSEKKEEIVCEY